MNNELMLIKNKYGEEMMHFCRSNFATILETKGELFNILSSHFDYSKKLYSDIKEGKRETEFVKYINSFTKQNELDVKTTKTPEELLDEAGYILYECKTEEEIQRFKKYYANNEQLCTFRGGRLKQCRVFFAVKKNVSQIKRKDFKTPKRQDLYGTSVISIQFTRGTSNVLSIKNRYNHTVANPDATFSNNLENIIPGLTDSFEKKYNLNIKSNINNFELYHYVMARDGKYYKYNYEINNVYYCPNNVVIDNFHATKYDKDRYVVFDYFILDMKEKKVISREKNGILDTFSKIKKVEVRKENGIKRILIDDNAEIGLDDENNIISYKNNTLENAGNMFLYANYKVKHIDLPKLKKAGNDFLKYASEIEKLYLPELESVNNDFLLNAHKLKSLELPKLTYAKDNFLEYSNNLKYLYLPSLKHVGHSFLWFASSLKTIDLPNLLTTGEYCFCNSDKVEIINFPSLNKHDYEKIIARISYLKGEDYKEEHRETLSCFGRIRRLLRI